jgi:DNA-binding XRE family transcriptional regulator
MRVPVDLHPDDLKTRLLLINELRAGRETLGISTTDLDAALGVAEGTNKALERRTSWEARTMQRYARALGRHLTFTIHNIRIPDDDVTAVVLAAGDTSTPQRVDKVHWRVTCHQLRAARRHRFTAVAMAARLGVTENAVHYWEANPDGSSIISAQRWARALDGWLGYDLTGSPASGAY